MDSDELSSITDLDLHCLAVLVGHLHARDVCMLSATHPVLREALADSFWGVLCKRDFKGTSPRAWLDTGAAAAAASPHHDPLLSAPQPRTFRELYPELARASQLVGYWTGDSSAGPRGSLYRFSLADDCVRVEQLAASKCFRRPPPAKLLFRLGPGHPQHTFSLIEPAAAGPAAPAAARTCLVREQRGAPRRASSAAAEAAAAVASGGGHSSAAGPLGTSPTSGFGFEFLQFMAGNIAPAGRSRSGRKLSGSGSAPPPPLLHHFQRLPVPAPTRQHPLAGLWSALYGPHGLEVLKVEYNFSGSAATIVATKVLGDPNVPAGQVSWICAAAPIAQPWPDEEAAIISRRGWYANMAAVAAHHWQDEEQHHQQQQQQGAPAEPPAQQAAEGAGALEPEQQQQQQQQQQQAEEQEAAAADAPPEQAAGQPQQQAPPAPRQQGPRAKRVVACHTGRGRVAGHGFTDPAWVEGRLFVYDDGTCGFLWTDDLGFLIDLERLEG